VRLVLALASVRLFDEWFAFLPAGLAESYTRDLRLSYTEAGALLVALGIGGFGQVAIAADHVNRRVLATGSTVALALCLFAFAAAGNVAVLLLACFVWGAASDGMVHGCEVALVDLYPSERLAGALARVNLLGSIGDLLAPATLATAAALGVGWRGCFTAAAVVTLLYAGWLGTQRFPAPHPPEGVRPFAGMVAILRDRRVVVLAILDGLLGVLDEPLLAFAVLYLQRVRGESVEVATLVAGAVLVGAIAGYPLVDRLAAGRRPAAVLAGAAAVMAVAVAALVGVPVPAIQAVAGFLLGAATAVFWTVLQATYLSLRPGQAGSTVAAVSIISTPGVAFPLVVGAVADAWGLTAGLTLYAAVPVLMLALARFAADGIHGDGPAA
jgi:predicted MFS family arabinose efflux permease